MVDINKKIDELEQNTIRMKSIQASQNDSFRFYAYQTENLWNALPHTWQGTKISVEFKPYMKKRDKVICRFIAEEGTAVHFSADAALEIDPTNHLRAIYTFYGYDPPTSPPSFLRFCYIGCYTNCEGDLIWSRI